MFSQRIQQEHNPRSENCIIRAHLFAVHKLQSKTCCTHVCPHGICGKRGAPHTNERKRHCLLLLLGFAKQVEHAFHVQCFTEHAPKQFPKPFTLPPICAKQTHRRKNPRGHETKCLPKSARHAKLPNVVPKAEQNLVVVNREKENNRVLLLETANQERQTSQTFNQVQNHKKYPLFTTPSSTEEQRLLWKTLETNF